MSFKNWKAGFWICFVPLLLSNGYWFLALVDQAITNKYTSMELYSQEKAVTELGKLITTGIESKPKKDVFFLLRQANPDAFIVDGDDVISYQNISFYFKDDKLVSIGEPRT